MRGGCKSPRVRWRLCRRGSGKFLQQRGHHGDQRRGGNERLLQHSVGVHALHLVFVQRVECPHQQNHRNVREALVGLHVLANFVAIAHRHEDVRQNQVGAHFGELAHRRLAVAHRDNGDAHIFQGQRHHLLDVAVVVRH